MSDVSAAFDIVLMVRLLSKLAASGVPDDILKVFTSWLEARLAEVVVSGALSVSWIKNIVFQGTVVGPMLWSVFYEDASRAMRSKAFIEIVFADDLNAFRKYDSKAKH